MLCCAGPASGAEANGGVDAAYIEVFLIKYVCPRENCFGTMAPCALGSTTHECNMCGCMRTDAEFMALFN